MFWGLTIEPGKHYTQTVDESFHVSMAALETRDVASPERDKIKMTQLMVQHDKAEFLVCTLCYASNIFQQYLDLNFTEGEEVTFFSEGRATIHLTGYLVRDEPMSMDPDMMSMDEASSSDEAASNSEGLASAEESSGEAQVKVERSYQLQRVRQRRRSQKASYFDVRQRQRKQFIWPDRQLRIKKKKVPPVINLKAETFISRKRNVRGYMYIDDETLRGTGQRSKGSLRHRSVRVSKKQSLLTERIPSYCNWSETPSTVLAQAHADSPMISGTQEAINQLETAKTSSIGGHLVSYDLTGMETNSPSTDEQGNPLTTQTATSTIAKTNLSAPQNQLTHANDAKDCTSYVGFPGTRKEIRQAKECPEKHVSLSRGMVPSIRSKHRGVVKAGRLNYHQSILVRSKYHSTKPHSGQSSAGYTTSASHRKRTPREAGFLTFSRGQPTPTRHSRINLQDTSDSTLMGGGASQPIISNVVGGPEAAVVRRRHFETTAQKNIGGHVLQMRECHTDGGNSEVLEIHNPSAVEVPQEQSGQSSTTVFQAPLAVSGFKEEQSGSTTEQAPSMSYNSNLVPTSLIVAYPGESNPHPRPGAGVQGFAMPETDSVYWSCMADDTGVGTGASTSDGIPVASDMTSLTAFDLNSSAINMPNQKIRLAHGFDVFILRRDLLQAERASKQSWSIFVRRLLDVLFDRVTLAMGRASNFGASHSERTPLDQNVVEALKAFFKARFNINKRELMQAIGYYCHDLRYKMMQDLQSM